MRKKYSEKIKDRKTRGGYLRPSIIAQSGGGGGGGGWPRAKTGGATLHPRRHRDDRSACEVEEAMLPAP